MMDYSRSPDQDETAHDDQAYERQGVWSAFDMYVQDANELQEQISSGDLRPPNTWGWPKYMFDLADRALQETMINEDDIDLLYEKARDRYSVDGPNYLSGEAQEHRDIDRERQLIDVFVSAALTHTDTDSYTIDWEPDRPDEQKRPGKWGDWGWRYEAFNLDTDTAVIFEDTDTRTKLGLMNSGTVINQGRVNTMGGYDMDGVLINEGDSEMMWNDGGIMINEGNVDTFTSYDFNDREGISINYGSAHSMAGGNGVMINFGDTEPDPYEYFRGGFVGLFHNMIDPDDAVCINYGEITGHNNEKNEEIGRKTGMGITSDGIMIAVTNPENGFYDDAAVALDQTDLETDQYAPLRQYLDGLEDYIGPENDRDTIITRLKNMEPDASTRIKQDLQSILTVTDDV